MAPIEQATDTKLSNSFAASDAPTTGASARVRKPSASIWHIVAIVACGVLVRVIYHFIYRPWWCADTLGYTNAYFSWAYRLWSDGARTPMYPLFLGFAQWSVGETATQLLTARSAFFVTCLQSALGIATAWLIYSILRTLGVRSRLCLSAALFFVTLGVMARTEMVLLAESLSSFALVLGVWLFVRTVTTMLAGRHSLKPALLTGAVFGTAALVKPENLIFVVIIELVIAFTWIRSAFQTPGTPARKVLAETMLALFVSAAPVVLGWMSCNSLAIGQFRMTTMTGPNMSLAVYNLFDRVDPADNVLGEILARSYRKYNRDGFVIRDHFWRAFPEILARHKEMPFEMNRNGKLRLIRLWDYVGMVSWKLALNNPGVWLRNAAGSFADSLDFRNPPPPPEEKNDPRAVTGGSVVRNLGYWKASLKLESFQAPFLTICYVATLIWSVLGLFLLLGKRNPTGLDEDVVVAALAMSSVAVIIATSLVSAYFPRYGVPHFGIFVICAAYGVHRFNSPRGGSRFVHSGGDFQ